MSPVTPSSPFMATMLGHRGCCKLQLELWVLFNTHFTALGAGVVGAGAARCHLSLTQRSLISRPNKTNSASARPFGASDVRQTSGAH